MSSIVNDPSRTWAVMKRVGDVGLGAVIAALISVAAAHASSSTIHTVVGPNAYANAYGSVNANQIFANTNITNYIVQIAVDSSQLIRVPNGALITGVGFRLYSGEPTVDEALDYASFDIQIGPSANAVDSLSGTFSDNEGAGTITAMSGPLTIPGGSFIGGQSVNPFHIVDFTTPYTYQSGQTLLVTIADVITDTSTEQQQLALDAVPASNPFVAADAMLNSFDSSGYTDFFNIPIVELTYTVAAVPEPSAWVLAMCGLGLVGGALRLRARTAPGFAGPLDR